MYNGHLGWMRHREVKSLMAESGGKCQHGQLHRCVCVGGGAPQFPFWKLNCKLETRPILRFFAVSCKNCLKYRDDSLSPKRHVVYLQKLAYKSN